MRNRNNRHERMMIRRRKLRERMRVVNVITGIGSDLTVKEIHYKTGLAEKTIRKIMLENPQEITFALLKKNEKEGKTK